MAANTFEKLIVKGSGINKNQFDLLMQSSNEDGQLLSEAVRDKNFTTPEDALAEICKNLDLRFIKDIHTNDIAVDLVKDIPKKYAESNEVLPYQDEQNVLRVLISNPLNTKSLEDLKVLFNKTSRETKVGGTSLFEI